MTTPLAPSLKILADKEIVQDRILLVKDKVVGVGKNGRAFASLLVGDQTGQLDARIWDNVEEVSQLFDTGDLVKIKGAIQVYNNRRQLIIHKLENANNSGLDKASFVIQGRTIDAHALYSELIQIIQRTESQYIKQLMLECVQDDEIKPRLLESPAAKTIHHAKKGGLLEHIVSICKIMEFMANHYKEANKDLLIFGALFHDLGKVWELEINKNEQISYTNKGQLLGHMLLACELIEKKTQRILGFPEDLKTIMKHIILAHHGKLEYGSPKLPMFLEAMIVAMIDDFDSKVDNISHFIQNERETGEAWSRYNENYERYFFVENLKGKWL